MELTLPLTKKQISGLHAGDSVLLSGTIYTARDCAHKRIFELLDKGEPLPFPLTDAFIYYAGPSPEPKRKASGSCGTTTTEPVS
ncbi:MAG: fumarate hydratase C-terminal domain-containing protein [Clostridia bacterium]|nr:fumarate hydratase C-terminal domain-containing protein [Clostridia bacterium]